MPTKRFTGVFGATAGFLLAASCHAQGAPSQPLVITLPQALQRAADNIEVSLARRAAAAARADVQAADHAPAPVVSAKAASIDLQNGLGAGNTLRDKRIDKSIGIDWTWERGGKRELRTRAAQLAAAAAQADLAETQMLQRIGAASAFYDLLAAQERIAQVEAIGRSAGELAQHAQRRVRAGDLAQQDALRMEIEAQRAAADLRAAQEDRRRAAQALALATGASEPLLAQGDWPPAREDAPPLEAVPPRADVLAAEQRVQAAQVSLDGASALRKSDVTLGTSIDHFPGTSTRQLELRVQMPLSGMFGAYGYDGEIARARAQLDQATDQLDKSRRAALLDAQKLALDLQAAAARALGYSLSIVPRAQQVAAMAELAYGKGAMSLSDLIDARRTLRNVLLEDIAARAEHARLLATWNLRATPTAPDAAQAAPGALP